MMDSLDAWMDIEKGIVSKAPDDHYDDPLFNFDKSICIQLISKCPNREGDVLKYQFY